MMNPTVSPGLLRMLTRAVALFVPVIAAPLAHAQDLGNFEVYQRGFARPIFVGSPPGETNREFVAEIRGQIHIVENGVRLATPFLNIQSRVALNRGLIGVAFPPDYAVSRRFYVNYTPVNSSQPRICRYTVSEDPNIANTTEEIIFQTGVGGGDHNAGWMEFGPDGYLYIARGDTSGSPGGNSENGQDINVPQAKILRLDVSPEVGYAIPPDNPFVNAPGLDEAAAIGLRNPWRNGFDRLTGDLYISDVGNMTMEEINFVPAGTLLGRNFGWPCMEGTFCRSQPAPCSCDSPPLTLPLHAYGRNEGQWVIGGTVYRGNAIPRWRGRYFFLDGGSEKVWSFRVIDGVKSDLQEHAADLNAGLVPPNFGMDIPISWGTDAEGELYILEYNGRILKIAPQFAPADWTLDGTINSNDFFAFLDDFFALNADITGDHITSSQDFFEYLTYFFGN
jgi:glucose/arabinose dehydrogenase